MPTSRVIVVGAGIGGLVAALTLASRGAAVTLIEKENAPGGKMREVAAGGAKMDGGPTVFTMRHLFEEIFEAAGASLSSELKLKPVETLARHAWNGEERLDLFADIGRSAEAIGDFAGPREASGYLRFCERARRIFQTLDRPFIRAERPSVQSLMKGVGFFGMPRLMEISPFTTLWSALGEFFADPRLRQLFGRYATYCGSSPYLSPATLMLIAHVEQEGVWLVEGGMHQVAVTLARLARERGAKIRTGERVAEVLVSRGRASGVRLASGEVVEADAVILNADVAALANGHFGGAAAPAVALPGGAQRSLSALTFSVVAETEGFDLIRHNVFFSDDYAGEFERIFRQGELPNVPTVYVCAQDRGDRPGGPSGEERLFILVNAPARGDVKPLEAEEIARCEERTFRLMERCGLKLRIAEGAKTITGPNEFEKLFPATGGALYGQASHGWKASFERPGARTRLPGLYMAGGSVHPGAGVPMAALSGRMAAERLITDFASTRR
ncbi:1-hydroxycarotenoid 3,4-desaturase CrtD [Afifella sp. IM 167]|uniref:1-hydroxycarotenoid 3,4-desaturase CrtD n=1 Tax=Afifella sp. IM 167 TaxID=2033586 RepID=UPI001CC9EBA5|nr:CrtD protein [Afifella sp. IM 167]